MFPTLIESLPASPFRDDVERIVREAVCIYVLTVVRAIDTNQIIIILTRKRDIVVLPIAKANDSLIDVILADFLAADPKTPWDRESVDRFLYDLIFEGYMRVSRGATAVHALIGSGEPVWN